VRYQGIAFGTAAAHYGLTTQHRNVIFVVTPQRLRERTVGGSRVQIVTQAESKFFGIAEVDHKRLREGLLLSCYADARRRETRS
jgi:predicted transcriptional regulator of viral defense system